MQLLFEEKNNFSIFRSPPFPPVVADAKAELLRNADSDRRFATRVGEIAGRSSTATDDDSMCFVAVSEPMTAFAKMLGLIDEASSKRPRVAVGVGARASKIGSTVQCKSSCQIQVERHSRLAKRRTHGPPKEVPMSGVVPVEAVTSRFRCTPQRKVRSVGHAR